MAKRLHDHHCEREFGSRQDGRARDETNHHLWKHARIGTFRPDGQVDMIYESPLIEPNPFPKL